jgi:YD repeat-containing protein
VTFNQAFTYDGLNRLSYAADTNQSVTNWARQYSYDTWGNMWVSASSGQGLMVNTPTSNVYSASTNRDTRWGYDAAGNLTTFNNFGSSNTAASYDAENRITSLSGPIGVTIAYDGVGNRVQKTVAGGSTTTYVYDIFGLAEEYDSVNGWQRDYIADGAGNLYATENASGPCTTCYFATDHLGSVRLVMDQNGGGLIARIPGMRGRIL